jgi:hypothetical protein
MVYVKMTSKIIGGTRLFTSFYRRTKPSFPVRALQSLDPSLHVEIVVWAGPGEERQALTAQGHLVMTFHGRYGPYALSHVAEIGLGRRHPCLMATGDLHACTLSEFIFLL